MPTYDYACSACGHRFERFEPIGEGKPKPCPKCGKKKARRMLGMGAGLIFKGSGFYATDSKRGSGKDSGAPPKDSEKAKDSEKTKDSEKKSGGKDKKEEKEPKK